MKAAGNRTCIVLVTQTKNKIFIVLEITRKPGGGTPIHYLYGYVPPNGVVILKLLV